jgi:hypothetical protein
VGVICASSVFTRALSIVIFDYEFWIELSQIFWPCEPLSKGLRSKDASDTLETQKRCLAPRVSSLRLAVDDLPRLNIWSIWLRGLLRSGRIRLGESLALKGMWSAELLDRNLKHCHRTWFAPPAASAVERAACATAAAPQSAKQKQDDDPD